MTLQRLITELTEVGPEFLEVFSREELIRLYGMVQAEVKRGNYSIQLMEVKYQLGRELSWRISPVVEVENYLP